MITCTCGNNEHCSFVNMKPVLVETDLNNLPTTCGNTIFIRTSGNDTHHYLLLTHSLISPLELDISKL